MADPGNGRSPFSATAGLRDSCSRQDHWGVFAGFDVARHLNRLGHSPSIQLRQGALEQAVTNGFALHNKGSGELAVAFRPDYLVSYIESLESLHECGQFEGEVAMLSRIARAPEDVDDAEVEVEVAEPRRYAIISAKRALRDAGFRMRVLTAYSHSCAMCGVQLRLLDGAHILPAAHPESTDGTDNGIALCALHHLAFDRALVTFDSEFRIVVNPDAVRSLMAAHRARGLDAFERALRPMLDLPPDRRDRPARRFVEMANHLRGWQPHHLVRSPVNGDARR